MKEKILTISIAAYNVEKYIKKAIDSLLIDDLDCLEVLVIDDNGADNTLKIAKEYEKKYPNTFRVIHKDNGGYGSTINKGIELATGKYFKQLDGDDWYDTENLSRLCKNLKDCDEDIIYTPYIEFFEENGMSNIKSSSILKNANEIDLENVIKFADIGITMYQLTYKTDILKKNNIKIDEHCFYTDAEYALLPFYYAKTIKVFNFPVYVYRIGRDGQSMSIEGRIKHYKDHEKVVRRLIKEYNLIDISNKYNCKKYIEKFMTEMFISTIASYYMILKPSKNTLSHIKEIDNEIKEFNKEMYQSMEQGSRTIKIIRKFKYNYLIYILLHFVRKKKIKK